jgi:hypothetical protein
MKINYTYLIGITLGLLLVFSQSIYAIDIGDMDVTPSSYDFGGVSIDSSKEKRFTIENTSATGSFTIEQFDMTGMMKTAKGKLWMQGRNVISKLHFLHLMKGIWVPLWR